MKIWKKLCNKLVPLAKKRNMRTMTRQQSGVVITVVLWSVLLLACYQNVEKIQPELTKEQMIAILADVHLSESLLSEYLKKPIQDSMAHVYYLQIFKIHKVSAQNFEQSMQEYMKSPEDFQFIYEKVLEKLQTAQAQNQKTGNSKMPEPTDRREPKGNLNRPSILERISKNR